MTTSAQGASSAPRRFRFGVNAWEASSGREWTEKARKLEALGYSTLLMPDHLADTLSPFTALAAAAQATSTLRVGTYVLNNDLRHPVVVAREIATLDLLTEGRAELGLGAGYSDSEYEEAGLRFDRGRRRVERLAEAVAIIKGLLTGEPVSFAGAHYTLSGHRIHPRPVQRPRPPLLIGGNGRALLELAGREADIVSFTGATFRPRGKAPKLSGFDRAGFSERVRWAQDGAAARPDAPERNVLVQHVIVAGTIRAAAEEAARRFSTVSAEDAMESPFLLLGPVDEIVDALRARRERWGLSYITIFERSAEAFAPIVAQLAGT